MAEDVGKGVVTIEPDTAGLGSKIARDVDGQSGIISKAFTSIGSLGAKAFKAAAVAGAAGVAAAIVGAKVSIDAASDLAEAVSKVDVVFGDQAKAVKAWSETSATAFGQSQQAALEAVGTYGNLFQAFGVGQKPAQEMSQTLVGLAADLASFNNTSTDEALTALRSGLSGETEPLKRYGVALNDVRLKEQALAMGLISTTKDALDPAAKAQAAYALIMQDTTLAQGDFARTSDGLANKQRILGAQLKNLAATVGTALLPVFLTVVTFFTDRVIPTLGKVWDSFHTAFSGEGIVSDGFWGVIETLGARLRELVDWVRANWPTIRTIVVTVLQAVGKALAWLATNVLRGLRIAITETVDWVRTHWDTIRDVFVRAAEIIASTVTGIVTAVGNIVTFLADNEAVFFGIATVVGGILVAAIASWTVATWAQVTALWAQAAAFAAAHAPMIAIIAVVALLVAGVIYAYQNWGWFRDAVDAVAVFMRDTLWPILQTVFTWMMENIPPVISAIVGWITGSFVPALQAIYAWVADNVFPIVRQLAEFFVAYWTVAFNLAKVAVETVISVAITLWGWLQTLWDRSEGVRAFIAGAFKLAWDTATTAIGLVAGAVSGVYDWLKTAWDRGAEVVSFLVGAFSTGFSTAKDAVVDVKNALLGVWNWMKSVWDRALEVVGYLTGAFKTGMDLAAGAWDVVSAAAGVVVDIIKDVISWAGKALTPLQKVIETAAAVKDIITLDIASKAGGAIQPGTFAAPAATGGFRPRFSTFMAGEHGPEYVTLGSSAGYVTPNHRIGSVDLDDTAPRYNGPLVQMGDTYVQSPTDVDLLVGELNYTLAAI